MQEYAQALHGRKIDQIHVPTPIDDSFLPSARRIVDYRCGGSFAIVLDGASCFRSAPRDMMRDAGAIGRALRLDRRLTISRARFGQARGRNHERWRIERRRAEELHIRNMLIERAQRGRFTDLTRQRRLLTLRIATDLASPRADKGSVYSAGYGALGLGPKTIESQIVRRLDTLEDQGITRIRAGWGWATAVRGESVFSLARSCR